MSRVQIADDKGTEYKDVWLGPVNSWRWPFDATFGQWRVGFLGMLILLAVLPFAVPLGLLGGAAVYAFARKFAAMLSEDHERTWRRGLIAVGGLFLAALSPSWKTWVLPMPFLVAVALAPILAVLVMRRVGRYIDWNRPFAWWRRLPAAVAAGPRLLDAEQINPEPLRFSIDPTDPGTLEVDW